MKCLTAYYLFSDNNDLQVEESSEARQKFSNAKSISSSQFFGDQANLEKEGQISLQKFSVSISLRVSWASEMIINLFLDFV